MKKKTEKVENELGDTPTDAESGMHMPVFQPHHSSDPGENTFSRDGEEGEEYKLHAQRLEDDPPAQRLVARKRKQNRLKKRALGLNEPPSEKSNSGNIEPENELNYFGAKEEVDLPTNKSSRNEENEGLSEEAGNSLDDFSFLGFTSTSGADFDMNKELIKLSNALDQLGYAKMSNVIDGMIFKKAGARMTADELNESISKKTIQMDVFKSNVASRIGQSYGGSKDSWKAFFERKAKNILINKATNGLKYEDLERRQQVEDAVVNTVQDEFISWVNDWYIPPQDTTPDILKAVYISSDMAAQGASDGYKESNIFGWIQKNSWETMIAQFEYKEGTTSLGGILGTWVREVIKDLSYESAQEESEEEIEYDSENDFKKFVDIAEASQRVLKKVKDEESGSNLLEYLKTNSDSIAKNIEWYNKDSGQYSMSSEEVLDIFGSENVSLSLDSDLTDAIETDNNGPGELIDIPFRLTSDHITLIELMLDGEVLTEELITDKAPGAATFVSPVMRGEVADAIKQDNPDLHELWTGEWAGVEKGHDFFGLEGNVSYTLGPRYSQFHKSMIMAPPEKDKVEDAIQRSYGSLKSKIGEIASSYTAYFPELTSADRDALADIILEKAFVHPEVEGAEGSKGNIDGAGGSGGRPPISAEDYKNSESISLTQGISNEVEGDLFRKWVVKSYPEFAKNPLNETPAEPLDQSGSHRNQYIGTAWARFGHLWKDDLFQAMQRGRGSRTVSPTAVENTDLLESMQAGRGDAARVQAPPVTTPPRTRTPSWDRYQVADDLLRMRSGVISMGGMSARKVGKETRKAAKKVGAGYSQRVFDAVKGNAYPSSERERHRLVFNALMELGERKKRADLNELHSLSKTGSTKDYKKIAEKRKRKVKQKQLQKYINI